MMFYEAFEKEVNFVKKLVNKEVIIFTPGLKESALKYLERRHLMPDDPLVTGISLYLPFWLGTAFEFKNKTDACRDLSAASLYLTLSVELQDSLQDEASTNWDHLWLSNAFFIRAIRVYQSLFPGTSTFWNYFEKHMHDLYQYALWERGNPFLGNNLLSDHILSQLGKQTSFLKPTSTAMALLGGTDERIEDLSTMLEKYHIGLKLVDDFVDWESDLKNVCYSSFLGQVLRWKGENSLEEVAAEDVRIFIMSTEFASQIFEKAIQYTTQAKEMAEGLNCPYITEFLDYTHSSYVAMRKEIIDKQLVFREYRKSLIELFTSTFN